MYLRLLISAFQTSRYSLESLLKLESCLQIIVGRSNKSQVTPTSSTFPWIFSQKAYSVFITEDIDKWIGYFPDHGVNHKRFTFLRPANATSDSRPLLVRNKVCLHRVSYLKLLHKLQRLIIKCFSTRHCILAAIYWQVFFWLTFLQHAMSIRYTRYQDNDCSKAKP